VEASVGVGVETHVEAAETERTASEQSSARDDQHRVHVQMLGPLTISREGVAQALPASRKVRALFAYLALAPRAVGRSHLCELLWDVPNDPRAELRWSLSKIRSVLDEPGRRRVEASGDAITLDLADCFVDAAEITRATQQGIATLEPSRLQMLSRLFVGDFLEGLEIDRNAQFNGWLTAQRRRFRVCHAAILEHLVKGLPNNSEEVFGYLQTWLELAPFDRTAHEILLSALAQRGRIREGDEHVAATHRLFEAEGLDWTPIRQMWQVARGGQAKPSPPSEAVPASSDAALVIGPSNITAVTPRRASIAVMPFVDHDDRSDKRGGFAGGLTHDVITRLAKLRSLFVIAQGTVFALGERSIGAEAAGRTLNVDYVTGGSVLRQHDRVIVTVELSEARTARIVWTEAFDEKLDDAFQVLDEIGNRIVASIASEIEAVERNRAILKPPSSLDAWEAYHRGLWHMYRFNKADNDSAAHFFQIAVNLDPTFARAHAGLSFTHWQNAFQHWAERERESELAFEIAGQSLIADDRDPAAHWAMGRALWLRGRRVESLTELETAVDLSPNFALGHYMLAFVNSTSGDPRAAIGSSDHSRHLSPFDPLLFGMLGTRAMALLRLGEFEEAADWAVKAAGRPNAHVHILAIAAQCLALAGRVDEAHAFAAQIHKKLPDYRLDDFFSAFRFSPDAVSLFRKGAERIGMA
jgi:DNA-binding SARP family transcriptional activator/tetratricopeptide (TPR) repeat protein